MKGGGNRVPKSLKKLRGTMEKHRERPDAPTPEPGKVPPPPKDLTALQKGVWSELAAQVEALGVFAPSHLTSFRLMVEAVSYTRNPDPRDPATAKVRMLQAASSLLQRFGLDPASQDRVGRFDGGQKTEDDDDLPVIGAGLRALPGGAGG